ncbi:vesicle transport protein USE1-like isoform X2 [Actinia tenebrosa]|uniref:Vesicle transport protein USE1 n=1 Tax=Actinia tenebrosa TaxID=6105 RepID=A0A6P8IAW8_ACTTE|nr:vesicle transport protein USE1-like isoform X2 [Actinia tenebrosa]
MAPYSRLEIDLVRLLDRCESMAHEQQNQKQGLNWRLEKYVCTLQNQIIELSKAERKPNQDTMNDYTKRINFLKGIIETEKKGSLTEKALASQQLPRPLSSISATSRTNKSPAEKAQELHIKTKARIEKEMREELLGSKKDSQGLRNRRPGEESTKEDEESIDSVLQYHQNMQEKIAEDMVRMAQSLKHTSMMASNIIKKDHKKLETSTRLVDSNFVKLKQESDRIEEITNRHCACWMWIALAMVVIVFIMTILFIRVFPKRQ